MKHVKEMNETEKAAKLAAILRGPKPEPMPIDKTAREMTPAEREAFLREVKRRFE